MSHSVNNKGSLKYSAITLVIIGLFCSNSYADSINMDEELQRIAYRADKLDKKISLSNLVYDDRDLTLYVNSIMVQLYPEYADVFQVRLYVSTDINAFVLPNGSIYLNLGLLAKAENEAQIAAILAHEGAHYIANHQLQKQQELKYIASGADFFGYERTRSLISDYSKDLEQEADNMGFVSLVRAGYDTKQAVRIFTLIAEQTKALNIQRPNLYSTHPKLIDRINYYGSLNAELAPAHKGYSGRKAYMDNTSTILIYTLQLNLSKYSYKNVLLSVENNKVLLEKFPQTWFYLGEAYRQRGKTADLEHSQTAYLEAIKALPTFAPSYKAMGISLMKTQHPQAALQYFERYLALAPHARDQHYIEQYYQQSKQQVSAR